MLVTTALCQIGVLENCSISEIGALVTTEHSISEIGVLENYSISEIGILENS